MVLGKSAPWPPKISDENICCTGHVKCIFADPLQTSHARHRSWNSWKTHMFGSLLTRCIHCVCHKNNTWASKSGPHVVCFYYFGFNICFAPKWGALFYISTSKSAPTLKCFPIWRSKSATKPCTFSATQCPKVLRTRCFSEPTFWASGAAKHETTASRDLSPFLRTLIFFLPTLSLPWLLSPLLLHLSTSWQFCF